MIAATGYQWAPVLGVLAGTIGLVALYAAIAAVADWWQDRQARRTDRRG